MSISPTAISAFDASRYPRAYAPSVTNRAIWISFGGLLLGFGAILAWLFWRDPEQLGPNGPAVVIAISGALALLGIYLILSMLFSKIILRPDAIEVRSLLSSQTMLRQEIAARRSVPQTATVELIPIDKSKKTFKVAIFTNPDDPFRAWFESIPDLDAAKVERT